MFNRFKHLFTAPEAKASRTAKVLAFESGGRARWTPRDYAALAREGYLSNAIVHRAVRLIAENAASCSFLLYEGAVERDRHPLLQLLARPNPRQDGASFFETLYAQMLLAGNAYVEGVALDDEVRELYALRPDRIKVVPGADGWPDAYEYAVAGRSVRFEQAQSRVPPILHLTFFHPLDDHYGCAPIEAAAVAVDAAIQIGVLDTALVTPPAIPAADARYLVPDGATGAWSGQANAIACREDGAWRFLAPKMGWCIWSAAGEKQLVFDGSAWRTMPGGAGALGTVTELGVNATPDSENLLSVCSNAALFSAIDAADSGTGDMRLQISKEGTDNTASVVFSDGFSARAEFGLVGSNAFKLKVSNDGTAFTEAFNIDQATGNLTLPRGVALSGVISPATITADQNNYNPAGLATCAVLQLAADAARAISGLAGGAEGRVLAVLNVGSMNVTLRDDSGSSVAANRFSFGSDLVLGPKQAAVLRYDGTAARWFAIARNSGAGGGGSGTVTSVAAGTGLAGGPITSSGTLSIDGAFGLRNRVINPSGQIAQTVWSGAGGSAAISIASPAVVTLANHNLPVGARVIFTTTGALPTGITVYTPYYVIAAGYAAGAFQISATKGGTAVNASGSQSGSHTVAAAYGDGDYGFDQWVTLAQSGTVLPTLLTNAENGTPFAMRYTQQSATAQRFGVIQPLENANIADLRGQIVTLSARVRLSASATLRYAILEWTGTADAPALDVVNDWTSPTYTPGNFFISGNLAVSATGSAALTASTFASVALTASVSGAMNNLYVLFWTEGTTAQSATLDIGRVQLEAGSTATPPATRPYSIELMLCQRYFCQSFAPDFYARDFAQSSRNAGFSPSAAAVLSPTIDYPVAMRVNPTITPWAPVFLAGDTPLSGFWQWYDGSGYGYRNSTTTNGQDINKAHFQMRQLGSGMATGSAYIINGDWTANARM